MHFKTCISKQFKVPILTKKWLTSKCWLTRDKNNPTRNRCYRQDAKINFMVDSITRSSHNSRLQKQQFCLVSCSTEVVFQFKLNERKSSVLPAKTYTSNGKIVATFISSTSFKAHHFQSVKSQWFPSFIFVRIDKQKKRQCLSFTLLISVFLFNCHSLKWISP